jgi:hypothetical protein
MTSRPRPYFGVPPLADHQPAHFVTVPCGAGRPVENMTADWSRVTCGPCRLEQPPDATGRPEYQIPQNVAQRDAQLATGDMLWLALHKRVLEEQTAQARMSEMIAELHELRENSTVRVRELRDEMKSIS